MSASWFRQVAKVAALIAARDRQLEDFLTETRRLAGHSHPYALAGHEHPHDHSHTHTEATRPHCEIYRGTSQSIAFNAEVPITFTSTLNSNGDLRSGASIIISQAGRYLVRGFCEWTAYASDGVYGGYRSLHVVLNGGAVVMDNHVVTPQNTGPDPRLTNETSRVLSLAVGDTLTATVVHYNTVSAGSPTLSVVSALLSVSYQMP